MFQRTAEIAGLLPNSDMPYYITALAVKDTIIFAGTDQNGIFRSTNYGISWSAVNNGLENFQNMINAFAADGTTIYAGTAAGLCLSTDNGEIRSSLSGNVMDTVSPNSMVPSGSYLVVSTDNKGIFYSSNNGTIWNKTSGNGPFTRNNLSAFGNNVFLENWSSIHLSTNNG